MHRACACQSKTDNMRTQAIGDFLYRLPLICLLVSLLSPFPLTCKVNQKQTSAEGMRLGKASVQPWPFAIPRALF